MAGKKSVVCSCGARADVRHPDLHSPGCEVRAVPKLEAAALMPEPPALRIVCTKCPAVATVHRETKQHSQTYVWAECHGEHVWGPLPGKFAGREHEDILFNQINNAGPTVMLVEWQNAARDIALKTAHMDFVLQFLDASGRWLSLKEVHSFYETAERNMLMWQGYVDAFKKRMAKG